MLGFEVMATQSFLTKLPKVSKNQFSAFYNIIGHLQRLLNSNFKKGKKITKIVDTNRDEKKFGPSE